MKIAKNDNHLRHFIREYKEQLKGESPEVVESLTEILNFALEISSNKEEFFELLSSGNFRFTSAKENVTLEAIKKEMMDEKAKMNAYSRAGLIVVTPQTVKDDNPYSIVEREESCKMIRQEVDNLGEEEKKLVTEIFFNDRYMKSLVSEMNTTMDHLSLLRKNAFAYLLRRVNESINGEEPYQTTEGPRGRSLSIGEKKNN